MKRSGSWKSTILLAFAALSIHLFSLYPALVEKYYAMGIYPWISAFLQRLFGWLPFSAGDIVYGLVLGWLLLRLLVSLKKERSNLPVKVRLMAKAPNIINGVLTLYIIFNLLWGINYNRLGISDQLKINLNKYSTKELIEIDSVLLQKVNAARAAISKGRAVYNNVGTCIKAGELYQSIAGHYPFLEQRAVSIKKSLWGHVGNYIGFIGYYNPFTGEAQLNTTVPQFLHPYTACHEMAHQLGYAKENEANFVGYLAASSGTDSLFHYSVYLDLFLYTQKNLYTADSIRAKFFYDQLHPDAQADLKVLKKFNDNHRSFLEPVFRWVYGKYLQNNEQPSGILSYDEVTGFLIAYYKKYGRL